MLQFQLNDSHYLAYVHWAGDGRDTIVVLTRDINPNDKSNSRVWISRDYSRTFQNRTGNFTQTNGGLAVIDRFYASPIDNTKVSSLKLLVDGWGENWLNPRLPFICLYIYN